MIWSLAFVLPTSPHKQHIPFNGQLFMSYKKIASNEMFKMAAPVIKRAKKTLGLFEPSFFFIRYRISFFSNLYKTICHFPVISAHPIQALIYKWIAKIRISLSIRADTNVPIGEGSNQSADAQNGQGLRCSHIYANIWTFAIGNAAVHIYIYRNRNETDRHIRSLTWTLTLSTL